MEIFRSSVLTLSELLPDATMEKIRLAGSRKHYQDGELIQQRGDTRRGFSILLSGKIVAGNIGRDGSFLVSSVLPAGDCFGEFTLFANLPRTHDLTAVGQVEVLHLTEAPFTRLFDSEPAIGRALLSITLHRSHELLEFLDAQRRLPLPVRVARMLLSSLRRQPTETVVRCRQEELATTLGVTRVSIGKALKLLAELDLIHIGYGMIEVPDVAKLRKWNEEQDQVMPLAH